jgi:hypothetical protein
MGPRGKGRRDPYILPAEPEFDKPYCVIVNEMLEDEAQAEDGKL